MGSNHNHEVQSSGKNIAFAFVLNLSFAIIELIGGILTNSVAILSDALHDFGDSLSLGVAYYLQKISGRKGDSRYSYGYKRFSLLGSIFISSVLVISSVFIIREGIIRLINPLEANAHGMLLLSILGIIVNGAAVLKMKNAKNHNEKAVFLHMMEDVLGWIAVLIASIVMIFIDIPVLDPILSISITLWVLYNVYKNLKDTVSIMLQEVPKEVDIEKIKESILGIDEIESIHDLHLWSMDGENHILTVHIVYREGYRYKPENCVKRKVRDSVLKFGINHVTIETESKEECSDCSYNNNPC
ncbi:MAG: cation diffusion facilitator family transporter [Bacteroidales bacterium]